MAYLIDTNCCALSHLTAWRGDSERDLRQAIGRTGRDYAPSTVFAITLPDEKALIKNLKKIGFRAVATFPRRPGLPAGRLTMWMRDYAPRGRSKIRVIKQ